MTSSVTQVDQAAPELPLRFHARIHGESMLAMPTDLYIPPDALEVFLDTFEGPLDLLLYLIRRASLNILDIQMAPLTAQYLVYVEAMRSTNLELAADYLLMAATLLDIKSRMLLPKPPREKAEDSELDPRAELVRRLMEYERMKRSAQQLERMPRAERDFEWVAVHVAEKTVERLPDIDLIDLQTAWLALLRRAKLNQNHHIQREELSVREHMTLILRRLQGAGDVAFEDLFDFTHGVASLVVGFLAVLELVKERLALVTQNAPMEAIYVRINESANVRAA
ncbi:ScpA family protein [Uliginosibacterium flavum]|uniref:Segregation and condensation protein A n=1 Tax=Uliginosibacterium flavum TaxID=1396831 RepID=A0ABV2TFV6_9RHOO